MSRLDEVLAGETNGEADGRPLVAIIEDDDATLSMYSLLLEAGGYAVLAVRTGAELLARLRTGPSPVAILMDLGLPDTQGVPLCRVIRAHHRFRVVPIVAVTGWSSGPFVQGLDDAPFDEVLLKPVDPDVLLGAVRRYAPPAPSAAVGLGDVA